MFGRWPLLLNKSLNLESIYFEKPVNNNNTVRTKPQQISCDTVVNSIGRKLIKVCTYIEIVIIYDRTYGIECP